MHKIKLIYLIYLNNVMLINAAMNGLFKIYFLKNRKTQMIPFPVVGATYEVVMLSYSDYKRRKPKEKGRLLNSIFNVAYYKGCFTISHTKVFT